MTEDEITMGMTHKEWLDALDRSGLDLSLCKRCNKPVICLPDGLSNICESCVDEEYKP